jgi:hypothetical protein
VNTCLRFWSFVVIYINAIVFDFSWLVLTNHDKRPCGWWFGVPHPSYCTSHWRLIQILPIINQLTVPNLTTVFFPGPRNSVCFIREKFLLGVSKILNHCLLEAGRNCSNRFNSCPSPRVQQLSKFFVLLEKFDNNRWFEPVCQNEILCCKQVMGLVRMIPFILH